MIKVCLLPDKWHEQFKRLKAFAKSSNLESSPPVPLILGGWAFSSDHEKRRRWEQTIEWAKANGCEELITINDDEYYVTNELSN
jgi:hypothetical protein